MKEKKEREKGKEEKKDGGKKDRRKDGQTVEVFRGSVLPTNFPDSLEQIPSHLVCYLQLSVFYNIPKNTKTQCDPFRHV